MHADELRAALTNEPFRAFRLHFSSGRVVEVANPELVVVSSTGRSAFAYRPRSDAFDVIDLRLVEAIELGDVTTKRRKSA